MCIYFRELTTDQQIMVKAIFEDPPRLDISWTMVFVLLNALADTVQADAGVVRVVVRCREKPKIGVFACSSEQGQVSRQMVKYLRDFLRGLGVEPH